MKIYLDDVINEVSKMLEAVIAALDDGLFAALVVRHGLPSINDLIAGFDHEPESFRVMEMGNPKITEFFKMLLRQIEVLSRVEVTMRSYPG